MPVARLPLAELRVIDLADEKGELCGRLLGDLGAEVVRVEPPAGACSRRLPPFDPETGTSLYFAVRNFNKRSVALDLSGDEGRAKLLGLVDQADVLIESFKPGTLESMGLGPQTLLDRRPELVVTSITDFGLSGPYRDLDATDPVIVSLGGMLARSGLPLPHPPLLPPGAMAYDIAGVTAAFATLLAYWQRLGTGQGQHLDVSAIESASNNSDWSIPNASQSENAAPAVRAGSGAAYPLYPCRDGYVRMVILSPRQWRALRAWMGDPPWLMDPKWDQLRWRHTIRDRLAEMITDLFRDWDKVPLAVEAQKRGLAVTPVLSPAEVLDNEHLNARGTFLRTEVAPGVVGPIARSLIEMDGERLGFRHGAPAFDSSPPEWLPRGPDQAGPATASAPASGVDRAPATPPLAGLRVLDFGIGGVGVETGRLLAEYGADVIKIETHTYPDFMRTVQGTWMSAAFASSSRSKRSFGVNLSDPRGRMLLEDLVRQSDVVVENSAVGVMERLGADYETLRSVNPGLVMVSSQLLGPDGPWSGWIGYGPSTRPVAGLTYLWNYEQASEPAGSGAIFPDHLVGRVAALGAMAGLIARRRGQRGSRVVVPQVETTVGLLADLLLAEARAPGTIAPAGNRSRRGSPWGVYRCAGNEQWCAITVRSDQEWLRMREALGSPKWASEERFSTTAGRLAGQDEIDSGLEQWTTTRPPREVMDILQSRGVPCGMMQYPQDALEDPHLRARGYLRTVHQPELGNIVLEGPAFRGSDLAGPLITRAPALGEHTRDIAQGLLGLVPDEVAELLAAGVLEEPRVSADGEEPPPSPSRETAPDPALSATRPS